MKRKTSLPKNLYLIVLVTDISESLSRDFVGERFDTKRAADEFLATNGTIKNGCEYRTQKYVIA
jgi:hypothetical protein